VIGGFRKTRFKGQIRTQLAGWFVGLPTICFEWQSCCLRVQYDGGIWASEPIPTISNDVFHGLLFDFNPKITMIRQNYFKKQSFSANC